MHLVVLITGPGAHPAAWRMAPAPYAPSLPAFIALAQAAESGACDAILFPPPVRPSHATGFFAIDSMPLVAALGGHTTHIGLGGSIAMDTAEPFNIARTFAGTDRLTNGRAMLLAAPVTDHARAAECLSVTRKLWDSWEDEAVLRDKASGRFTDAARVHRVDHAGPHFRVRGPLNAPRPIEGNPLVILSDASPAGLALAASTADIFIAPTAFPDRLQEIRAAIGPRPRLLATLTVTFSVAMASPDGPWHVPGAPFTGTPEGLAAFIHGLQPHCDGVAIAPAVNATDLPAFIGGTIPALRARALRPPGYTGTTSRAHFGLPRPRSQFAA